MGTEVYGVGDGGRLEGGRRSTARGTGVAAGTGARCGMSVALTSDRILWRGQLVPRLKLAGGGKADVMC